MREAGYVALGLVNAAFVAWVLWTHGNFLSPGSAVLVTIASVNLIVTYLHAGVNMAERRDLEARR